MGGVKCPVSCLPPPHWQLLTLLSTFQLGTPWHWTPHLLLLHCHAPLHHPVLWPPCLRLCQPLLLLMEQPCGPGNRVPPPPISSHWAGGALTATNVILTAPPLTGTNSWCPPSLLSATGHFCQSAPPGVTPGASNSVSWPPASVEDHPPLCLHLNHQVGGLGATKLKF